MNSQDGGAAVSVGRRKNAPRKRGTAAANNAAKKTAEGVAKEQEDEATAEEIDPNEPRYCLCGDVSYGTMICCENSEVGSPRAEAPRRGRTDGLQCEKEWFHMECVGLSEEPPRRTKWYCPDCRS